MIFFMFKEVWYWCATDGFRFPASELSSHQGHKFWPIGTQ